MCGFVRNKTNFIKDCARIQIDKTFHLLGIADVELYEFLSFSFFFVFLARGITWQRIFFSFKRLRNAQHVTPYRNRRKNGGLTVRRQSYCSEVNVKTSHPNDTP